MKLVTYQDWFAERAPRLGILIDELVVDVENLGRHASIGLPSSMLGLIDAGPSALDALKQIVDAYKDTWPIGTSVARGNVRLLSPIQRPRKNIFGIGLNYVDHVEESSRSLDTDRNMPDKPVVFSKPPTTVIGPTDPIEHNAALTQQLDWEVELGVIIGKTAKRIDESSAMSYVFGYTVINDVSARDNRRAGQWIFSKGQDTYCPMGPCIVTADEIADPHNLRLELRKNGVVKQQANTAQMYFRIPNLIADIASAITLEPGDIIEAYVEGIGTLRNPVVAV